jgi:hypothetical protein
MFTARSSSVIWFESEADVETASFDAVNCSPGKMSSVATRPFSAAGSVMAPSTTSPWACSETP